MLLKEKALGSTIPSIVKGKIISVPRLFMDTNPPGVCKRHQPLSHRLGCKASALIRYCC